MGPPLIAKGVPNYTVSLLLGNEKKEEALKKEGGSSILQRKPNKHTLLPWDPTTSSHSQAGTHVPYRVASRDSVCRNHLSCFSADSYGAVSPCFKPKPVEKTKRGSFTQCSLSTSSLSNLNGGNN